MEYQKIPGLYAREAERPHKIIPGQFREPAVGYLAKCQWAFTEKIDGTNIRVIWDGHKVKFGGRTDNASLPAPLVNHLTELFGGEANEQVFEQHFGDTPVTIYGEGYGAKIQSGGKYSPDQTFAVFDVMVKNMWLLPENVAGVANLFGAQIVPTIFEGTLSGAIALVENGLKSHYGDFYAEGLVGRPSVQLFDRMGQRVLVKLKHDDLFKGEVK